LKAHETLDFLPVSEEDQRRNAMDTQFRGQFLCPIDIYDSNGDLAGKLMGKFADNRLLKVAGCTPGRTEIYQKHSVLFCRLQFLTGSILFDFQRYFPKSGVEMDKILCCTERVSVYYGISTNVPHARRPCFSQSAFIPQFTVTHSFNTETKAPNHFRVIPFGKTLMSLTGEGNVTYPKKG
jgi:hypothetical protein